MRKMHHDTGRMRIYGSEVGRVTAWAECYRRKQKVSSAKAHLERLSLSLSWLHCEGRHAPKGPTMSITDFRRVQRMCLLVHPKSLPHSLMHRSFLPPTP